MKPTPYRLSAFKEIAVNIEKAARNQGLKGKLKFWQSVENQVIIIDEFGKALYSTIDMLERDKPCVWDIEWEELSEYLGGENEKNAV